MSGKQYWDEINRASEKVTSLMHSYWHKYSDWGNWQFWVILLFLLAPLIVLLMKLDRIRTFEILFFGYTVHMLWTYTDLSLIRQGFLDHNNFLLPFLPQGLAITASLIPISLMLVYQYCLKPDKNFFVWAAGISAILAFGFAPMEKGMGLISLKNGFTIVHLFFIDLIISIVAYGLTKFFIKFYTARQ
ncbi:hypothetical protein L1999_12775 [Neobacillus drentensis]|uniref:hypothetical protein n=1 Tax=Neobacillus drentensis TaxID=220684 RepID=UPI001F27049F|nr:hypothetical protein [Neobacillus drentensis]ULT59343.1 hypothetical protein L1999_12775 [Neobacillus drentensis]